MILTPARRTTLVLGMVPVIVGLGFAAFATSQYAQPSKPFRFSADVPVLPGGVLVRADDAPLTFGVSPDGFVHVTGRGSYTQHAPGISARPLGEQVVVDARTCASYWFISRCGLTIKVLLPASSALTVQGTNGDITATGIDGPLRIDTTNGSISVLGTHASTVTAQSTNGDVVLAFAAAPDTVAAATTNGRIGIRVPGGPYAVSAHTVNGRTDTSGVATAPGAPRTITASTVNGDVIVGTAPSAA